MSVNQPLGPKTNISRDILTNGFFKHVRFLFSPPGLAAPLFSKKHSSAFRPGQPSPPGVGGVKVSLFNFKF